MDFSPYAVGGAASRGDSFTGLDDRFRQRLWAMLQAAEADLGPGSLRITSAYRSPELQAQLYESAIKKYGSPEAARKWVAPPGRSRHNSGLAVDFAGATGGLLRDANSREAKWLKENADRFGLAIPMDWEPWQVEAAWARGGEAPSGEFSAPSGGNALRSPEGAPTAPDNARQNQLAAMQQAMPRANYLDPAAFQVDTRPVNYLKFT